jgi:hypothetical protein
LLAVSLAAFVARSQVISGGLPLDAAVEIDDATATQPRHRFLRLDRRGHFVENGWIEDFQIEPGCLAAGLDGRLSGLDCLCNSSISSKSLAMRFAKDALQDQPAVALRHVSHLHRRFNNRLPD